MDQDLAAATDLPLVTKALQGGEGRHWSSGGLCERHTPGLSDELGRSSAGVFRKRAAAGTKYRVSRFEFVDIAADGFDFAGYIDARASQPRFGQAEEETKSVRLALHQPGVQRIDGSGADADQHLIVFGGWLFDVLDLHHVFGRPVTLVNDGFHDRRGGYGSTSMGEIRGRAAESCINRKKATRRGMGVERPPDVLFMPV